MKNEAKGYRNNSYDGNIQKNKENVALPNISRVHAADLVQKRGQMIVDKIQK
jgi:hypothetical protein